MQTYYYGLLQMDSSNLNDRITKNLSLVAITCSAVQFVKLLISTVDYVV